MNIAKEIFGELTKKFDHKLTDVTLKEDLEGEVRELVHDLYGHKDAAYKIMGTLFNSIYTHQMTEFLMSKSLLESLLATDSEINDTRKSINGKEFSTVKSLLISRDFVEILDDYEKPSAEYPEGKASRWVVCSRKLKEVLKRKSKQDDEHVAEMLAYETWDTASDLEGFNITNEILLKAEVLRRESDERTKKLEAGMARMIAEIRQKRTETENISRPTSNEEDILQIIEDACKPKPEIKKLDKKQYGNFVF